MRSQHGAGGLSLYSLINKKKSQVTESARGGKRNLPRTGGVAGLGCRPGLHPHPHLGQPPNIQIQPEAGCNEQVVRATGPPLGLCSNVTLDVETQFQCPQRPWKAEGPLVLEGTSWRLVQVSAFHNLAY